MCIVLPVHCLGLLFRVCLGKRRSENLLVDRQLRIEMSDRFESEEMPSLLEMTGFYQVDRRGEGFYTTRSDHFCFQMAYLFVLWLGEKAAEKVFTSLRLILWSIVLNRLFPLSKNRFLIMMDRGEHHSFSDLLRQLNLMIEEEQHFLQMLTDDQRESIGDLLKASKSISSDAEHRLMVNIEHVDDDYLLKSSKETSSKECFVVSSTLANSRTYYCAQRGTDARFIDYFRMSIVARSL